MAKRKVEILAPAGSYRSFRAAVSAGADAVYAGGPRFGARAYAENFTENELIAAIKEAHLYDMKLYLTVNTLMKNNEIDQLSEYLRPLYEAGLDAVIVQDIGAAEYIMEHFPGLDLHASTQMTITGAGGARFAEQHGFQRVVPARELSLREIRQIRETTGLEIECFVHGALCYCYSGQCLLSSMIGGRSGNRGQCAQPCRLPYTAGKETKYFLSPKDICTLELIPEMIDAGIDSFKIEGRMKQPEYVAGVTAMYRKYADLYLDHGKERFHVDPDDRKMLMDLYNRGGSSTGYYNIQNGREMMSLDRPNHAGVPALLVQSQKGRKVTGKVLEDLNHGDVLELTGGRDNYTVGQPAKKNSCIEFLTGKNVFLKKGTVVNRVRNDSLLSGIREKYVDKMPDISVRGKGVFIPGRPAALTVSRVSPWGDVISYTAHTEDDVQEALTRGTESDRIYSQLNRTGGSGFIFSDLQIEISGNVFLPISRLNSLRREAFEGLKEASASRFYRKSDGSVIPESPLPVLPERHPYGLSVLAETADQLRAVKSFIDSTGFLPGRICVELSMLVSEQQSGEINGLLQEISASGTEICAAMPYILRTKEKKDAGLCKRLLQSFPFDSILLRNYEEYQFVKESGFDKKLILDHNLYVFNRFARTFWNRQGVFSFSCSYELNAGELRDLQISDSELEVYGYTPVMISAQCVVKTKDRCTAVPGLSIIRDRLGNPFQVRNCCDFCYNIIYNTLPVYLGTQAESVKKLSPDMLRVRYSTESPPEVVRILELVRDNFFGENNQKPDFKYTQGHFRRGVI